MIRKKFTKPKIPKSKWFDEELANAKTEMKK